MVRHRMAGVFMILVLVFRFVTFVVDVLSTMRFLNAAETTTRARSAESASTNKNKTIIHTLNLSDTTIQKVDDKQLDYASKTRRVRTRNGIQINLGIDIVNSTDDSGLDYWPEVPPELYEKLSRAFEPWSSNYSWCEAQDNFYDDATPAGILFVKVPKAASSTLAGIVLRIAHGRYGGENQICTTKHNHVWNPSKYSRRDPNKSFMFGNVRDVVSRELSQISYRYARSGPDAAGITQPMLLEALKSSPHFDLQRFRRDLSDLGFQLGYLSMTHINEDSATNIQPLLPTTTISLQMVQRRVERLIQDYDFITVTERMDESLVALQLILNLDAHDLLYLPTKVSGSYAPRNNECVNVHKVQPSPQVSAYLQSTEWYTRNYGDYLLYKAVNASLDKTIQQLGQERFNVALAYYRQLLHEAHAQCSDEAIFPCSANGTLRTDTNCYFRDFGCGYPCLDQIR